MYSKSSLQNYCVCVDLVRKLNSDILMQRIKTKGAKHPDYTKALSKMLTLVVFLRDKTFQITYLVSVKEKLGAFDESEISTTSMKLALTCPVRSNFLKCCDN